MLKLGVYKPGWNPREAERWWVRRRLSYQLLRTSLPPSADEITVFEMIMREMRLTSGVFRTTSRGRFDEMNQWVNGILGNHFAADRTIEIQDWAASACITSVEWYRQLQPMFRQLSLTASDLSLYLIEMRTPDGSSYIVEAGGHPLQYIKPPFVVRLSPPEPAALPVNLILASQAKARFNRLCVEHSLDWDQIAFTNGADELHRGSLAFAKVPLIHPEAVSLEHDSPESFRVVRHSVFEAFAKSADVIRTMNILNKVYFDDAQLMLGARCVWNSLRDDGIWIVGRTVRDNPPVQNTSVLQKTPAGFRLVDRFGEDQSEIEDLALAMRP